MSAGIAARDEEAAPHWGKRAALPLGAQDTFLSVSRPHWGSHLVWLNWRHRRFREAGILAGLHRAGPVDLQWWQHPAGPPRRLSLVYAARRPG